MTRIEQTNASGSLPMLRRQVQRADTGPVLRSPEVPFGLRRSHTFEVADSGPAVGCFPEVQVPITHACLSPAPNTSVEPTATAAAVGWVIMNSTAPVTLAASAPIVPSLRSGVFQSSLPVAVAHLFR